MKPQIGQPVAVYGGLENSLSEHAAQITFVHKTAANTLPGQLGVVNVRVFLDKILLDRNLAFIPFVGTRQEAIELNARGAGYAAYPLDYSDPEEVIAPGPQVFSLGGLGEVTLDLPQEEQVH